MQHTPMLPACTLFVHAIQLCDSATLTGRLAMPAIAPLRLGRLSVVPLLALGIFGEEREMNNRTIIDQSRARDMAPDQPRIRAQAR